MRSATGQVRTAGLAVIGLDIGALLALGRAAGACTVTLAEVLPAVEDAVVHGLNAQLRDMRDG
nr:hypothetical protein [Rhodoplanes serenus]